jgi:hypothetical protein
LIEKVLFEIGLPIEFEGDVDDDDDDDDVLATGAI